MSIPWSKRRSAVAGLDERSPSGQRVATFAALTLFFLAFAALPWALPYVPVQDGPSHFEIAKIFLDLLSGGQDLNARFYEIRPGFLTNFGTELFGLLLSPIIGPVGAERMMVTGLLIAIPLAIVLCIRRASGSVTPLMLFALPYGYSTTLASGNLNFLLSLALGLFVIAWLLPRPRQPHPGNILCLAVLWLVAMLIHPAGTVVSLFFCGQLVLLEGFDRMRRDRRAAWRLLAAHGVAVLPTLALFALFLRNSPASDMEYQRSLYLRVREFILQYELYKFDRVEIAFSLGLSVLLSGLAGLAVWKRRNGALTPADRLLVLAVSGFALYAAAPNKMAGGDAFVSRIECLPWIFLLIWLSMQSFRHAVRWGVLIAGILLQSGYLVSEWRAHAAIAADAKSYLALASVIPRGRVVLPLIGDARYYDARGNPVTNKIEPMKHLHNAVAARDDDVFLENWNAHYRVSNIRFQAVRDPYIDLWSAPDRAAGLEAYENRTRVRPDYVLIWRMPTDAEGWASLRQRLDADYEPVASLPGPLLSEVLRRR